jgi:RNA polymerase sigma factor (sigma-70 family)
MPTGRLRFVLGRLRAAALVRQAAERSDGQLLEAYVARREEAAFEALVRRHGPMVLGVCRRLLGHEQDAEDAFQATFLVLVRKAASIRPRHKVGSWLYGVAYRAAQKARAAALRRAAREKQVRDMPEPAMEAAGLWHDLVPLLDEEMSRLPEKYRLPIVLCDLEGQTRKEAARQLGWPEGTVAGRLAGGRALLARRLGRHGVPVSAGVLAAVLAQGEAVAAVPLPLVQATVQAASVPAAGAIASAPAVISQAVLRAMVVTRLKMVTAVLLLTFAGAGVGLVTHRAGADAEIRPAGDPPAAQPDATKQVVRKDNAAAKTPEVAAAPTTQSTPTAGKPKRPRGLTLVIRKGPRWVVGQPAPRDAPKETPVVDLLVATDAGSTVKVKAGITRYPGAGRPSARGRSQDKAP